MDIMDTSQVSNNEILTQIQFTENDLKTTEDCNGINSTTYTPGDNEQVYNIPLPPTNEYENEQMINETIIERVQENNTENSVEIEETQFISLPATECKSDEPVSTMNISTESIEIAPSETTESETEVKLSNNEAIIEYEQVSINEIETENQFIDESLSLSQEDSMANDSSVDENVPTNQEIIVEETQEDTEKSADEIATDDNINVQYTVLPPGENSVIQEDGTLVVEYPLTDAVQEEEVSCTEIKDSDDGENKEKTQKSGKKQQKPKGRKPTGQIPSHIAGHNIEKPAELANGGKITLKPRLGVKIPYRNLTSQMISNSELRQQIVERARQKQEAQIEASQSRIFAKKLTYRLAQSLTGKGKIGKRPEDDTKKSEESTDAETCEKDVENSQENIENNSDLIAILEGDGEDAIITQVVKNSENSDDATASEMKEIEKEISSGDQKTPIKGKKFFKSRESSNSDATKDKIKDAQSKITTFIVTGGETEEDETEIEDIIEKKEPIRKNSPKTEKIREQQRGVVEVEPQLKPAMVVKTYTRKRKSSESPTPLDPPKKPLNSPQKTKIDSKTDFVPPNVYMTKSSRIIKKKIIWDPDEAIPSVRNQNKILSKIEATIKTTPPKTKSSPAKISEKEMTEKKTGKNEEKEKKTSPQSKNLSQSQIKSPKKYGKRLTEIDKLLMDEGAVNMLYDINNSDEQKRRVGGRLGVQTQTKESKTQEAASTPEIPRARKKDTSKKEVGVRKMSKDSSKSSVHSPPPSPADFSAAAEASRIIRRHSSSSFSSNNEDSVTESVDELEDKQNKRKYPPVLEACEDETTPQEEIVKTTPTTKKKNSASESNSRKKLKKNEEIDEQVNEPETVEIEKPVEITVKSAPGNLTEEIKTDPLKPFTVVKMNKHYMINLTYSGDENYLTLQLLNDLTVTLKELGKNKNCNVVSVHSQGSSFCLGLDYKCLVENSDELRKKKGIELSNVVREFVKCLLNFPKVLVAGIKSDCIGFAVTILPLFDIVIASDSASFFTPYGKLGCQPEVGFLLSSPFHSNNGLAAELLYTTQRMSADEAHKRGLVTKLFWPEKFDAEFLAFLSHISNLSKLCLIATKKQLRQIHCQQIESLITTNFKTLVDRWISNECQKNFISYNALTYDMDKQ